VIRAAALFALLAAPAFGQDYVVSRGKVSDDDFYRLVACGAVPGEPCAYDIVRWSPDRALDLRVRLEPAPKGFDPTEARLISGALDNAIAQLNNAGARLALRRVGDDDPADIRVFLSNAGDGDLIQGTGYTGLDGERIGAAMFNLWWDDDLFLTEGVIVMASGLPADEAGPVMLEELTQTLGLQTDIRNPRYEDHSVFSEDSNSVRFLGGQDITTIRRHYPSGAP
jgi:hypothetical protein